MNLYKESFGLLKKDKGRTLAIILIEFLFLFILFLTGIYTYNGILDQYDLIQNIGIGFGIDESEAGMFQAQNNLILLNNLLNKIFFSIFYFAIFMLIFMSLVLGLTSAYCVRFVKERELDWKYFSKFFVLSLIWLGVFVLIFSLSAMVPEQIGGYVLGGLFLIVSYFAMSSFSMFLLRNNLKEGIKAVYEIGIKRVRKIFPHYLSGMVILLGISGLFTYLSEFYEFLAIIGIVVFLFLFVWFRVLFLKMLE